MRTMSIPATLMLIVSAGAAANALPAAGLSGAQAWEIGPIIRSRNHSVGMPLHPTPSRGGWFLDFPYPDVRAGHVHYVSFNHGPLTGKRRIVVRYRIDAAPGVRFVARETPALPATLSLYFQRRGDNWTARGRYEAYRWYAPARTVAQITPGVHEMTVSLDENWTSVTGSPATANPRGYSEAIADADRVGIVLGSSQARGHGVYATGPARLTVISFRVM